MSEHPRPAAAAPEQDADGAAVPEPRPSGAPPEPAGGAPADEAPAAASEASEEAPDAPGEPGDAAEGQPPETPEEAAQAAAQPPEAPAEEPVGELPTADPAVGTRGRRDLLAAALIGVLTLLLGFAFAVQVRSTDADSELAGAREEDLVRILDELNAQEDRLRQQIADQRSALDQLNNSDSQSAAALEEARQRAQAIGILNGTIAAQGPGLRMLIRDPDAEVRVADVLDAIQELRGAGAETMQIDGIRIGVSTAVTGEPGALFVDGKEISAPYEILVIGSPQNLETAMNIPGGVVQRIGGRGGSVEIAQADQVVVDALRALDRPQYASPESDGG